MIDWTNLPEDKKTASPGNAWNKKGNGDTND